MTDTNTETTNAQSPNEALPSLLAELLLYHAALGRGYRSPFPATKGLVFTSALPTQAIAAFAAAEVRFRSWHEEQIAADRKELEALKDNPPTMAEVMGGATKIKQLEEKVGRLPNVLWKDEQVIKSTLVELLKRSYYGAMTYLDPVGAHLAASLCHSMRLASDLSWITLTEGTTDETFIRAGATGGALIHSLAGADAVFNHFCSCQTPILEKLMSRIKESVSGQVGIGSTVIIPGDRSTYSRMGADTLESLIRRVYVLGEKPEDKRVQVTLETASSSGWQEFLAWGLPELIDEDEPVDWQWKLAVASPASPQTSVRFGARAAMVAAFVDAVNAIPNGPISQVTMGEAHLEMAKAFARLIYRQASGHDKFERRTANLKSARDVFITPQKLAVAKRAMEEAIALAENRRVSRDRVRREIAGVTLGLLDELVRRGDIAELNGVEECQMGRTKKAYTLPMSAPPCDPADALDEIHEAAEDFGEHPEAFDEGEAFDVSEGLQKKALAMFHEHFLPVVPLSRMSSRERRMLPKILALFPRSFVLRGSDALAAMPEPEALVDDEDCPLDDGGNLWVRYHPDGQPFCEWESADKLGLGSYWGEEKPPVEPG